MLLFFAFLISCKKEKQNVLTTSSVKELSNGIKIIQNINTGSTDTLLWKVGINNNNTNDSIYIKLAKDNNGQFEVVSSIYTTEDSIVKYSFKDSKIDFITMSSRFNSDSMTYVDFDYTTVNKINILVFGRNNLTNTDNLLDLIKVTDSPDTFYIQNRNLGNLDDYCSNFQKISDYLKSNKTLSIIQALTSIGLCISSGGSLCGLLAVINLSDLAIGAILGNCNSTQDFSDYLPPSSNNNDIVSIENENIIPENVYTSIRKYKYNGNENKQQITTNNNNCFAEATLDLSEFNIVETSTMVYYNASTVVTTSKGGTNTINCNIQSKVYSAAGSDKSRYNYSTMIISKTDANYNSIEIGYQSYGYPRYKVSFQGCNGTTGFGCWVVNWELTEI